MTNQVCVIWKWKCPLCFERVETYTHTNPFGWYKLSGCRNIPVLCGEDSSPQEVPEWIICPKCAKVLERAMEKLHLPFQILRPNMDDYSKPISLGRIVVMA